MSLNPKCSFRIIGLSDEQQTDLVKLLTDEEYRTGSDHRDRSKKSLRVILHPQSNATLLQSLLSLLPKTIYYDFFVAIRSNDESLVVEIPEYVVSLRDKVGGKICFSCTFILDD